jgi:hypothetical protein
MQFTIRLSTLGLFCAVAFLFGCLLTCNCTGKKQCPEPGTIVKTDTVRVPVKDSATRVKPKPVQTTPPAMAITRVDSFIRFETLPVDSAAIVAQYKALYEQCASERKYHEAYAFDHGNIEVESIVHGNELMSQTVKPTFYHTVVTNTVQAKQRNSVWIGVDGLYNRHTIGAGASLMFLHKRGWAIEGGAAIDLNGGQQYRAAYKRKLSFK